MLWYVVESVTDAEVVDEALVPLRTPVALAEEPYSGTAVTVTVVPAGMFVAATVTVTGLVVVKGNITSGEPYWPDGLLGAFTPPIVVITRAGTFVTNTVLG